MKPIAPAGVRRLGFSMIELLVVLALIAIMTALIIPEMKGTYEDALLRSTSRKLVDVFQLASSRAISINRPHRVRLDRENRRYLVERMARDDESGSGFVPVREGSTTEGSLDPRISIEIQESSDETSGPSAEETLAASGVEERKVDRQEAIAFYPSGTAEARDVVLRDRDGFRILLRINPITARVHVLELERK